MKIISSIVLVLMLISGCTTTDQPFKHRVALSNGNVLRQGHHRAYPDYLYTLVGFLSVEGPHSVWRNIRSESFGTFWQGEYHAALELYSFLLSLRDRGIISGSVTIYTDEVGRTYVSSREGKKLISSLFVTEIFLDFFGSATDEQRMLYLESVYKRWGVAGYNILINPEVNHDILIDFLTLHTSDIYTINGVSDIPGIRVFIFKPLDDLAMRLVITRHADITIAPAQNSSRNLLIRQLPYDTYDDRYSISLHLSQLNHLDTAEVESRLKYLNWVKGELRRDLETYERHGQRGSTDKVAEIRQLIEKIDEAIAQHLH